MPWEVGGKRVMKADVSFDLERCTIDEGWIIQETRGPQEKECKLHMIWSAKCRRFGVPVGVPAACKDLGGESCDRDDIHPVFSSVGIVG